MSTKDIFLFGQHSLRQDNLFSQTVQKRGGAVIQARKLSSAMSAAKAACDHMKAIFQGTPAGTFTSMGVFSDGSYGTPPGVMFSFPITIQNKKWTIVQVRIFFIILIDFSNFMVLSSYTLDPVPSISC